MSDYYLYNNVIIPKIGYGTYPLKEELETSLKIAFDNGYRLLDTSEDYYNMENIGNALDKYTELKQMFIVTKLSWPEELLNVEGTISEYKKTLSIDNERPIDCLLLHFPSPYIYIDLWKEMEKLYLSGQCRAIGVCNFEVKHLKHLLKKARIKPMINQIELHPTFQQKEVCDFCKKNNIRIMAYSPLARMNGDLHNNGILNSLSKKHCKSIPQIILRWNIQKGYIPIPSTKNEEHIINNFDIFDFELDKQDMKQIDSLDCGNRTRYSVSTYYTFKQKCRFFKAHIKYKVKLFRKI